MKDFRARVLASSFESVFSGTNSIEERQSPLRSSVDKYVGVKMGWGQGLVKSKLKISNDGERRRKVRELKTSLAKKAKAHETICRTLMGDPDNTALKEAQDHMSSEVQQLKSDLEILGAFSSAGTCA
mmetsp:Transcript_71994/g.169453  ORF Transcript_71994/g.169453 Transcript_71994/m.169453 type:complete len:127 (-) Transcript_71994:104-484(-)